MTTKNFKGILSVVGNTPLIPLNKFFEDFPFDVFGKLEMYNPSGSIKDRAVLTMMEDAWERGIIDQDTTIIESSSGNTGVALAQTCASLGLTFICVVDIHSQIINRRIIEIFGGKIELVEKPNPQGGFLKARLDRIQHLLQTIPNSFNCDQYTNPLHPQAHRHTVDEILDTLGKAPDYIFCSLSTCGTIRGISEEIRGRNLSTQIIAVDAVGSVIFGTSPSKRLIPGHGASIVPPFFEKGLCDDHIHVADMDCIEGCRQLVKQEGLFVGGSSGGIITATTKYSSKIFDGASCVLILPDNGSRYINTIYNDEWVMKNYGEIPVSENLPAIKHLI